MGASGRVGATIGQARAPSGAKGDILERYLDWGQGKGSIRAQRDNLVPMGMSEKILLVGYVCVCVCVNRQIPPPSKKKQMHKIHPRASFREVLSMFRVLAPMGNIGFLVHSFVAQPVYVRGTQTPLPACHLRIMGECTSHS